MSSLIKLNFIFLYLATSHFFQGTDKHHSVSYSLSSLCSRIVGFIINMILYFSSSQFFGSHTAIRRIDFHI
ncbi:MAG: hypothetical protein LBC61_00160 [Candidatus Peribacteria bacterium]|nr:hypothetical protein [Candidatus Peribacteria bacterium]